MRPPRRRFLALLLLLLMVLTFESSAVTLRKRNSLDAGWGGEDFYYRSSDGVYCKMCPPGTYVVQECKEQNGSGRCEPCRDGEYMEFPNSFQICQECSQCREDQVEQSPCQPVRNRVCACRNGTFCAPEHPCEMCLKCQPRCPEGQVEQQPCRPDSDLQCGPAVDSSVPLYISVITGVAACGIVLVIALFTWKCCCSSPGDGRPSSRRPFEMVSSMLQKLPWCRRVETGAEDNAANAHLQSQQDREEPLVMSPSGSGSHRKRLVPAPGKDPSEVLENSFYIFADEISMDDWKRFGRSLGLEWNDVIMVRSKDDFYGMLYKWRSREGSKVTVDTLLDTLDRLRLSGVAERISSILVQNGTFQYETS